MKTKILFLVVFLCLVVNAIVQFFEPQQTAVSAELQAVGFENPVPDTPGDNLLTYGERWFKDFDAPQQMYPCGWQGWADVDGHAALSRGADKNPSADDADGCAVQWDEQTGCQPGDLCRAQIIVDAPLTHDQLRFSSWWVTRNLMTAQVNVYGCTTTDCDDGGMFVWQPWSETGSSRVWVQTPLVEKTVSVAYPRYRIELVCQYSGGTAGCKSTGIYLAAVDSFSTPAPTATVTITPTTTATAVSTSIPTPDVGDPVATPCSGWSPECFCLSNPDARICQED